MTNRPEKFPLTIGGRDVDISQIGYTLRRELRNEFDINAVPKHLVHQLKALIENLERSEADIEYFISTVRGCKGHEDFMSE